MNWLIENIEQFYYYIKENWVRIVIALLLIERLYYYTIQHPKFNSFMDYVEMILGGL
ncbi:MAG: hypothetical protein ACFFDN_46720 [Candidatus Hodarchaeota archaeon]